MSSGPMDSTPRDQQLAERLRQAVRSQEAPPELAVKIRQRLDEERRVGRSGSGLAMLWMPAAAALVISIAAGIVFWVVRALLALNPWMALRWPIKKIAALFGILSAVLYTLLVGAPLPTLRSVLMTGLVMGAVIADRSPIRVSRALRRAATTSRDSAWSPSPTRSRGRC